MAKKKKIPPVPAPNTYIFEYRNFDVLQNIPYEDFLEKRKSMAHILPGHLDRILAVFIADRHGVSNSSSRHPMALIAKEKRVPMANENEWDGWFSAKEPKY
jgi:hypothetical protein